MEDYDKEDTKEEDSQKKSDSKMFVGKDLKLGFISLLYECI